MMASLNAQLDIEQILLEAQHRWLRPAEICEILLNYKNFRIAPEPPNRPPSGSLFLFDRKVLRYFRKDGHNWRKKKDGKTVKEAHERLKAGSVDVLHCYYAHGEEDESFRRRSYWMLEEELSHIVLVHYREIKENRTNISRLRASDSNPDSWRTEEDSLYSEVDSSGASRFHSYDYRGASPVTDTASLNTNQATEHEDAESEYRHQGSPGQSPTSKVMEVGSIPYHAVNTSSNYQGLSSIPNMNIRSDIGTLSPVETGFTYQFQNDIALVSWESDIASSSSGYQSVNFRPTFPSVESCSVRMMTAQENELLDQVVTSAHGTKKGFGSNSHDLEKWQVSDCDPQHVSNWSVSQNVGDNLSLGQGLYCPSLQQSLLNKTPKQNDINQVELSNSANLLNAYITELGKQLLQDDLQLQGSNAVEHSLQSYIDGGLSVDDKTNQISLKQPLLDGVARADLKKLDSFDRLFKELGDVAEPSNHPGCGMYWEIVGSDDEAEPVSSTKVPLDNYILGPSISQDQLFSIVDFSPGWAYSEFEIKVLVMGRFLRSQEEVVQCKWACMFGEHEVPAEVVEDGVLQCYSPSHENGRVPFYVTCSNRLACSEVREFEFRSIQNVDVGDVGGITYDETHLHMRFGTMLSLGSDTSQTSVQISSIETSQLCRKISAMLKDDSEWEQMLKLTKQDDLSTDKINDQLPEKFFKEKLHVWLLQKIGEGGKGPSILDKGGQGILHFAAALGYDWAIPPTIAAGVSVNFRDANGWTALHWAAYSGRERTVGFLISLGAAPGFVTDPTPQYPSGRNPADLASSNGHKGIAGYLAESSLSSHLSAITLNDINGTDGGGKAVETVSDRSATPLVGGDLPHGLSMKYSLAAVRNATQAAARICQVYRVQSFQRKQLKEYSAEGEFGIPDARALSLLALKSKRATQHYEPVHAAQVIQNKFRSWKGRKDYLLIRQKIIKIQAHVRGHQVRKNYRTIIWSVGILDKVILRWRRKGKGLSGFRAGGPAVGTSILDTEKQEDDYDFLIEGRKQTEERLHKTLARVKSMVQYPEARDQYHRVLNVVSEMQEKMATYDKSLNNLEDDYMIDLGALLEDDTFMPMTP